LLHTWSLSIEEQFYLLWPVTLWFGLRSTTRPSLLCWILLGIVISVLIRIGLYVAGTENLSGDILPLNPDRLVLGLDTRADALLSGCLAGVAAASGLLPQNRTFRLYLRWFAPVSGIGLLILGACWAMAPWMMYFGWLAASIFAMVLIVFVVSDSGSMLHRVLEIQPLVLVGKISYGLYVWHFPLLVALRAHQLPWKNLVYLVWVFPVAIASYHFVEKPCLKWKSRFAVGAGNGQSQSQVSAGKEAGE
jgi:peptidoglycan/LPS O-acetylase OafA/YrhL